MIIKYNVNTSLIKFDSIFYKKYYEDLQQLCDIDLINHYIKHGKNEKRLFCAIQENFNWLQYFIDKKIDVEKYNNIHKIWEHYLYNEFTNYKDSKNVTTKLPVKLEFNVEFYKNKYQDLSNFNQIKLYKHYHEYGRKEKRLFTGIIDKFNFAYYLIHNNNLKFDSIDEIWKHYIYYGIKENKYIDYLTIIENVNEYNLTTNQKFVYNGILPDNNTIINSNYGLTMSSTNFPKTAIIYVYYNRKNELRNETNLSFFIRQTVLRDNKNLYMFIINGSITEVVIPHQNNVIVYKNRNCYDIETYGFGIKYILNRDKSIQRFVLMNSGITGPFYNSDNWLQPFENKINRENSVMCSTVCYRFNGVKHNPGYFNYVINDNKVINLLLSVLINYRTKIDAIDHGEYGMSKVLYKNGYKITSLVDNGIEGYRSDRDNNINAYNLTDLVFVKSVWRSLDGINRDSVPLKNTQIINYINNKCNFKNDNFNINYASLKVPNLCNNWKSKSDFYNKYGVSEEFIIYPINNNSNKLALYCHSDKDNLFRSYCIDSVNTLAWLGYKVIICTTCSRFCNVDNLPYEIIVMSNAVIDTFMIKKFLNTNNINNYSNLLCVNDSIIFPIHGFNNMRNTFNKFNNTDFWGIWSSPEQKEHIMSPFLHYSNRTFNFLKSILNKYSLTDFSSAQQWEVNMLQEMKSKNFSTGCVVDYRTLGNINYQCPIMHPNVFPKWIHRPEVFAIKWKYMGNYLNKNKLNIPYMNYLLRYLHFNHTGMKGRTEGCYGNPINYI